MKRRLNPLKNQQLDLAEKHAAAINDKEQEIKTFSRKLAFSKS